MRDRIARWKRILVDLKKNERRFDWTRRNFESLLYHRYSSLSLELDYKTFLRKHECSLYSQNGEDGLLLHLFSQVGITNCRFVEFGIGDGRQCNSANLAINFGWRGLMMDGSEDNVGVARLHYGSLGRLYPDKLNVIASFVTRENINDTLTEAGYGGQIDLLSIDIDGNDYWIWEKLDAVRPRVVVIEYNASFGVELGVSVPYEPDFRRFEKHETGWYHGASLKALEKLGKRKGYQLVGCDSSGVNAFFVRDDLELGSLRALSAEEAYYPAAKRLAKAGLNEQLVQINHLALTEV